MRSLLILLIVLAVFIAMATGAWMLTPQRGDDRPPTYESLESIMSRASAPPPDYAHVVVPTVGAPSVVEAPVVEAPIGETAPPAEGVIGGAPTDGTMGGGPPDAEAAQDNVPVKRANILTSTPPLDDLPHTRAGGRPRRVRFGGKQVRTIPHRHDDV